MFGGTLKEQVKDVWGANVRWDVMDLKYTGEKMQHFF